MLRNGYQAPVAGAHTMQHHHQHQHYSHPSQAHHGYGYQHGYTNEQLYMMAQLHHQRAMMGHGGMSASKQAEPKPRLSKDEVDLLEREFLKNSKPSSGRKREIAELLKVEHPRINNWFQNRRAKEKQMRKLKEFEAQQAAEMSGSDMDSPEQEMLQASSAVFPGSDPASPEEDAEVDFSIKQEHSPTSETNSCDQFPIEEVSPISPEETHPSVQDTDAYPSPRSLPFQSIENVDMGLRHLASPFIPSHPEDFSHPISEPSNEQPASEIEVNDQVDKAQFFAQYSASGNYDSIVAPIPAFPSQLVAVEAAAHGFEAGAQDYSGLPMQDTPPHTSSPTVPEDLRFKSPPPPANLASRRNRGIPGQLTPTALRTFSFGPKTGIEMPKRTDTASPMRRIASATGTMHRIQKAAFSAAPRSPLFIERTREALMRSMQGSRSPILHSLNTALSPVTSHDGLQGTREATVSSSASDDEQRYTLGGAQHQAPFFMKTPPTTPGLGRTFPEPMLAIDSAWNYPTDEPLITPGLGSFGSEEFSMAPSVPSYVVNSQPATPSYPSGGSGVGPTYFPFSMNGVGPSHSEYTFPGDSYALPESAVRLSPTQSKSKQFQFTQNITPQDFTIEK